jgi:hypothetical protein
LVEPLRVAINNAFPDSTINTGELIRYIPGIFVASLAGSLALGFVFEAKVSRMFRIKRERIASGLRWLDFRLPDVAIWLFLFSALFSLDLVPQAHWLKVIGINVLIVALVVFFCQGMATLEFVIRFYRFGPFTRAMTYLLIILQLAPFLVLVGFVDHWADFRRLIRRRQKAN